MLLATYVIQKEFVVCRILHGTPSALGPLANALFVYAQPWQNISVSLEILQNNRGGALHEFQYSACCLDAFKQLAFHIMSYKQCIN